MPRSQKASLHNPSSMVDRFQGRKKKKTVKKPIAVPATPKSVPVGNPLQSFAPEGYRRFFRFAQLAVGEAGIGRTKEDVWATFLDELDELKIPPAARARIGELGPDFLLGKKGQKGYAASITALFDKGDLGKEQLANAKATLQAARTALKGINPTALEGQWPALIKELAGDTRFQSGDGARILEELKALDPKAMSKIGSNQAFSALVHRGEDPWVMRLYNRAFQKANTAVLPPDMQEIITQVGKGKVPKPSAATIAALEQAGLKTGTGVGRKALSIFGKGAIGPISVGLTTAIEGKKLLDTLGRPERAKKLAVQGLAQLGSGSSAEYLREQIAKQELIARRSVTMQRFHPELFQDVVRVLSDTGPSQATLTPTERRIGSDQQIGVNRRARDDDTVKFLLEQLFSQMGTGGG